MAVPAVADVFRPSTLVEAVAFLAEHKGRAVPVAGGTDLMVDARMGRADPEWLVDLTRLPSLAAFDFDGTVLRIGSMTRIRALELDPRIRQRASGLVDAARVLGSVQIRTMATIGGNLCHGTPSAEMPPPLLVHDTECDIAGPAATRSVPLVDLFAGPNQTTLRSDEILLGLRLAAPLQHSGSCYLRQTVRWSMDLAGVGVAAFVEVDGLTVRNARVALGAVAPVPLLLETVAEVLIGSDLTQEIADEAGRRAAAACSPISDARGTAEYRRQIVAVLVPRALRIAWLRAVGQWPDDLATPVNGIVPDGGEAE
ncbi:MAG: xanthine dehydrogenase family protein subunit M [Actinomycetota bacterium]|nr:xanthine dehydrogenase family protein subunit M [Actinomycetota bacterium]